jgi:hypothetical protein
MRDLSSLNATHGNGKVDGLYDVSFGAQASPSPDGNDDYAHGTAVASLIAAASGDGFGMAGFGGAAHVVGVHAGTHGGFTDGDIAFALAKLDELGVRIVNLSLGSEYPSSPILVDAIHRAASDGMLIVAAAGNEAATSHGRRRTSSQRTAVGATGSPSARRTRTAASPRSPTRARTPRWSHPATSRATARACS